MKKNTWTAEQEEFLREHINDMSLRELGMHCENRSPIAIQHKLSRSGLRKANRIYSDGYHKVWTKEEDAFLKCHLNEMSVKQLGERCGNRSKATIYGRIKVLQLLRSKAAPNDYHNAWTVEQERFLRDNLHAMTLVDLGIRCGKRTAYSVSSKLSKMGLKKGRNLYNAHRNRFPKTWTSEQEQFLRDNLDKMMMKELGKHCGNRSGYTVAAKLRHMRLKKVSFQHVSRFKKGDIRLVGNKLKVKHLSRELILSVYPRLSIRDAARELRVCWGTLNKEIVRLGITKKSGSEYRKGIPQPHSRERMLRLWRTGYFADKFYPFPAPNKVEDKLLAVIQELDLPFRYVGDWKYQVGTLNPDFVHMSKPVCIDLFGAYWHSSKSKSKDKRATYLDADIRKQEFKKNGHDLLVIYEKELRDLESLRTKLVEYAEAQ